MMIEGMNTLLKGGKVKFNKEASIYLSDKQHLELLTQVENQGEVKMTPTEVHQRAQKNIQEQVSTYCVIQYNC